VVLNSLAAYILHGNVCIQPHGEIDLCSSGICSLSGNIADDSVVRRPSNLESPYHVDVYWSMHEPLTAQSLLLTLKMEGIDPIIESLKNISESS